MFLDMILVAREKFRLACKIEVPEHQILVGSSQCVVKTISFICDPCHGFGRNGFGLVSIKGKKKFMEGSHPIVIGISNKSFFGVYDSHGGCKAAEFVYENLHNNILELIKNCKEKIEKEEAIKAAYLNIDRDFLQEGGVSGACCATPNYVPNSIIIRLQMV